MMIGKRTNLYAVAGVLTTSTGNKVVAAKSSTTRHLHVVPVLGPAPAPVDVGPDNASVDWSQLWPYGGDAA